jgi:hypothetical protein
MVARGVARWSGAKAIAMIEPDHRVNCQTRGAHNAAYEVIVRPRLKILRPVGFLPYPHRTQTTSGRLTLAA